MASFYEGDPDDDDLPVPATSNKVPETQSNITQPHESSKSSGQSKGSKYTPSSRYIQTHPSILDTFL